MQYLNYTERILYNNHEAIVVYGNTLGGRIVKLKIHYKLIAWVLIACLSVTLIPDIGYASGGSITKSTQEKMVTNTIAPEDVTKNDVIAKSEVTTTYDLGGGEKMSVFHGGPVRYRNANNELVDYDPSLVSIGSGEKTIQNESLEEYAYTNKQGDNKQYIPESLSEQTPIILENENYKIEITPSSKTINESGLSGTDVEIEKEVAPTIYEEHKSMPLNAVYGTDKKPTMFKYTSGEMGVKETIILNKKPEVNVFEYKLNIGELKAKKNSTDEGITFYDEDTEDIVASIAL